MALPIHKTSLIVGRNEKNLVIVCKICLDRSNLGYRRFALQSPNPTFSYLRFGREKHTDLTTSTLSLSSFHCLPSDAIL